MEDVKDTFELIQDDLGGVSRKQIECDDCIEGECPARTNATLEGDAFVICSARRLSQLVIAGYHDRVGTETDKKFPHLTTAFNPMGLRTPFGDSVL